MNKENWNKFLSEIIKSSINRDEMIGDNLRTQCVEYFEQLETSITSKDNGLLQLKEELLQLKTNRDEAIEYIENIWYSKNTTNINDIGYTTNKLLKIKQLLERDKK